MTRLFYLWTRDLHLYFGLALSPFVLLFAISVIFLNHTRIPLGGSGVVRQATVTVQIPQGLEHLEGMTRVEQVKKIMRQVGVIGEVAYISFLPNEHRLVVPILKPGETTTLDLNLESHVATIQQRKTGIWDALIYLHKSPGQHLADIRGNWSYTRAWRFVVDTVVYLLLFLSASGIYLWAVLRAERRTGLILLGAGAVSFMGVIYAISL